MPLDPKIKTLSDWMTDIENRVRDLEAQMQVIRDGLEQIQRILRDDA